MRTSGINHVSIHANDLDESVRFYVELLEAELLDTPNFGIPVQWLGLGSTQLHVFIRDAKPQSHHHFGITVEDLEPVYRRPRRWARSTTTRTRNHIIELPGDVAQTYVRDPAGNLMEIDTPGASRLPEGLREQMQQLDDIYPQDEVNRRARLYVRGPRGALTFASSGVTWSAGIGRARWKPCASAQSWRGEERRAARRARRPRRPRSSSSAWASCTIAVTIAAERSSPGTSRRNERSILSSCTGRSRRRASEEKSAPKSSIASRSPSARSRSSSGTVSRGRPSPPTR